MGMFKAGDATSCVSHPVPMGRLTIASFMIAIVGVCFGLAALVMTIINAVRISRMKRGIDNRNHNESETKVSYVANKIKDEPTTSAHCITHQYFIHQQSHHITHAYSQVSIIFQILMQHNFWARVDFTVIIMYILPKLNVSMEGRNKCQRSSEKLLIALISNNILFWKFIIQMSTISSTLQALV